VRPENLDFVETFYPKSDQRLMQKAEQFERTSPKGWKAQSYQQSS
jgi:hypothetical protein